MHAVVLHSYRPLFFHLFIAIWTGKFRMGAYTSDNALRDKVVWQANDRRLSVENFAGENVDELIKNRQIRQYFPPSKFCAIR